MTYKEETRATYDRFARDFEKRTQAYIHEHILEDALRFIAILPGRRVLDIGSGPGRDSLFFKQKCLQPVCIDISPEMIRLCQEKGLEALVMDIEEISFPSSSFDGVWAYTSLLHLPKARFPSVLDKIKTVLKPRGVFYIGMKEGDFDGITEDDRYPGHRRYKALYSDEELRQFLERQFNIISSSRKVPRENHAYLNYLCSVKSAKPD